MSDNHEQGRPDPHPPKAAAAKSTTQVRPIGSADAQAAKRSNREGIQQGAEKPSTYVMVRRDDLADAIDNLDPKAPDWLTNKLRAAVAQPEAQLVTLDWQEFDDGATADAIRALTRREPTLREVTAHQKAMADAYLASPPVQAEQADLSALRPETQEAVRGWLADGTFVQRAIAVIDSQEKELMRHEQAAQQGEPSDEAIMALAEDASVAYTIFDGMTVPSWRAGDDYKPRLIAFARAVLALKPSVPEMSRELRRWNLNHAQHDPDCEIWQVGYMNEDGVFHPVIEIDTDLYDAPEQGEPMARAILSLWQQAAAPQHGGA